VNARFQEIEDAAKAVEPLQVELERCRHHIVHSGETSIAPSVVAKLAAGISSEALTGRELEVLTLLARGKSNKEIGANLYISETTVKSHLRSIFTKLTSSVAPKLSPLRAGVASCSSSQSPVA